MSIQSPLCDQGHSEVFDVVRNDSARNIDDAAGLQLVHFSGGGPTMRPRRRGWHEDPENPAVAFPDLLLGHLRAALSISRNVAGVFPAAALIAVSPKQFREIKDLDRLQIHLTRFLTWSAVLHGAPAVDEIRVRIVAKRGVRKRFPEIEILFAEDPASG